jgi:hypothetical protein
MYLQTSIASLSMTGFSCSSLCSSSEAGDGTPQQQQQQQSLLRQKPQSPTSTSPGGDLSVSPYHVLQIRRDATPSEIRQSYKRLALWHHPGRTHASREERQRRFQVFELLAACYETLMHSESRRRFDASLKDMEMAKLTSGVKGEMFMGGKRLGGSSAGARSPVTTSVLVTHAEEEDEDDDDDRIPSLSRSSTQSSSASEHEEELEDEPMYMACSPPASVCSPQNVRANAISLVDISMSGSASDEEAETHYTEATTTRLFGGPFSHLYRARNFEPFDDPFDVFETVFGTRIFHISPKEMGRLKEWMPLRSTPQAGWNGSSETSPDGRTTVFTTSRVLHDRRLTRTETISVHPVTGKNQTHVRVTAEDLQEEEVDLDDVPAATTTSSAMCLICYQPTTTIKAADSPVSKENDGAPICGDVCELYNQWAQEFDFDLYQNWMDMFTCNNYDVFPTWSEGINE